MSDNVVELFPPRVAGIARCHGCGYEWLEKHDHNHLIFDCERCGEERATMRGHHAPREGELIWYCQCGGDLFYAGYRGLLCMNCGTLSPYSEMLEVDDAL